MFAKFCPGQLLFPIRKGMSLSSGGVSAEPSRNLSGSLHYSCNNVEDNCVFWDADSIYHYIFSSTTVVKRSYISIPQYFFDCGLGIIYMLLDLWLLSKEFTCVYGMFFLCPSVGQLSPKTLSISSCTFLCTSG